MSLRRWLAALVLAGSALNVLPAVAQIAPSHEVRKGDTLFAIARKTKHDGVSRNQMILAIWRANQNAFPAGNINLLEVGTVLTIPSREAVGAIDSAEADRSVREMIGRTAPGAAGCREARGACGQAANGTGRGTGGCRQTLSRRAGAGTHRGRCRRAQGVSGRR
jgi:pilus assembly protein FimV